jgi:hypothetical protein
MARIGSIGERRDAKKINALIVNAIGTKIAIRRTINETKKLPSLKNQMKISGDTDQGYPRTLVSTAFT